METESSSIAVENKAGYCPSCYMVEQEEKENENGVGNREENGDDKTEVIEQSVAEFVDEEFIGHKTNPGSSDEEEDNRSSKKEYDSELKMVLECVSIAFTTWLDRREIVTLNCDVGIQSALRKLINESCCIFSPRTNRPTR
ncbi:hypothetical protein YC2023_002419 [Brassica napus]